MSGNRTKLIFTSSFETPPRFNHLRTPMCAIVLGPSIRIVLPTRSRGRLMDEPLGATSADVGFFGSYSAPAATTLTGKFFDLSRAAAPACAPLNCTSPDRSAAVISGGIGPRHHLRVDSLLREHAAVLRVRHERGRLGRQERRP